MTEVRSFECRPEAVSAARRFVREALSGEGADVIDAAELMASELTSNCVRHAETSFDVSVHVREDIKVEVRDTGGGEPRRLSPGPEEPSGRGLMIVQAMSDSWGVEAASAGKKVWFKLARSDSAAAARGTLAYRAG
jgi:anti-sigma regulatory factor (Ser/Thr protein kinase)